MKKITFTLSSILKLTLFSVVLVLGVGTAQAASFTVNSTADPGDGICDASECTLREAITAANANPGADTIVFLGVTGTINLTGPLPEITDGLEIVGPGPDKLTVRRDSGGDYGIFRVFASDLRITGLTISNGSGESGSGIRKNGLGLLEITNVTISGNSGGFTAGGIDANCVDFVPSQVKITDSTISNNSSNGLGGGICTLNDTVTISNSTVSHNNSAANGGGIAVGDGSLTISNSNISGNTSTFDGGGIFINGTLTISGSTIDGNLSSSSGGGIFTQSFRAQLSDTTVSGNSAFSGGGIYNARDLTILLSTITANSGNGVFNDPAAYSIHLESSIVDLNLFGLDVIGQIDSHGYNIFGSVGGTFNAAVGDQVGITADQLKLGPLQDNGGPTMTHALLPESVAIDRGINTSALTADQRGFPRTIDDQFIPNSANGDGTDVGAYEAPLVPPSSDLLLSMGADKTSVKQGDLLTYTITVQNFGPHDAVNTIVNNVMSSGATLYSVHADRGYFTAPPVDQTGTVTWYLGDLLNGDQQSAQLQVTVKIKGKTTITNSASVSSDVPDPNAANNSASLTTTVAAGGGGSKK